MACNHRCLLPTRNKHFSHFIDESASFVPRNFKLIGFSTDFRHPSNDINHLTFSGFSSSSGKKVRYLRAPVGIILTQVQQSLGQFSLFRGGIPHGGRAGVAETTTIVVMYRGRNCRSCHDRAVEPSTAPPPFQCPVLQSRPEQMARGNNYSGELP